MLKVKDIEITVLINEEKFVLHTYAREYRSVMALILDQICPDDFGECGGQGRCCTCLAQVVSTDIELPVADRNEAANLVKHQVTDPAMRLSCQLMLNDNLNNLILKL